MPRLAIRYARHLRLPNLVIVGLVQWLVYWRLVSPLEGAPDIVSIMLVILSTMLVGGAGFVINDLYDVRTDSINRPERVARSLSAGQLRAFYAALIIVGGVLAAWAGARLDLLHLWWLYPLAVLALWLYSARLKCMPLAGNLWVALFTGGVVLLVGLPVMIRQQTPWIDASLWTYASFAAMTNLYREIVKDLEDLPGDRAAGCTTLPVARGAQAGRNVAFTCGFLLFSILVRWMFTFPGKLAFLLSSLPAIVTATSLLLLNSAGSQGDYRLISTLIKVVMLAGTVMLFWL
jgi:4-hydroxybenzoate polyprenyltransferase